MTFTKRGPSIGDYVVIQHQDWPFRWMNGRVGRITGVTQGPFTPRFFWGIEFVRPALGFWRRTYVEAGLWCPDDARPAHPLEVLADTGRGRWNTTK